MGVLENINIHDGSGNTLSSTSSALDVNLKTSAATVTVAQPTGTNLHTVVDSGTITSITDPVTVVLEDGVGNRLTSTSNALDSNLKTIGGTAVQTGTGAGGAGIPRVTVSDDSKVQLWDGTNSAKFDATGETTVDMTRFGGSSVLIGQTNMAHSIPVVIAADQQLAVSGVYNNQTGAVSSGVVPNALNGVLSIVNDIFTWSTLVLNFVAPPPNSSPALSLGGTFQLEGSVDGTTWTALTGTLLSDTPEQITQYTSTGFLSCSARYSLAGFPWIRLRTTNPFTGTINVQQCLTTAQGDEVGFTTARIVDDSGQSVDLTPATQYTEGQSPQAIYFQGGQTTVPTFPETGQTALHADAVYVLPKRSQIGNTLVIAVVIQGTGLTAANLAPMWLEDTAGATYTLAQMYDSTVTSAGQAIALYVRTITAVDNEGQIGLMLGFNGLVSGGAITVTGINILAHEYSGLTVPGDSFAHAMTAANAPGEIAAPTAPYPGYLVYSLISSQTNGFLSMNRLSSGPYMGAAPYPVESATGDNITQLEGFNTAWDWVCIKLAIAATGTVMMGRVAGGGSIQPIPIDSASGGILAAVHNDPSSPFYVHISDQIAISAASTNFPVQLQDGASVPISSTGGALNVHLNTTSIPVTQSGAWDVTTTESSVGAPGVAMPAHATLMGAQKSGSGNLGIPQLDAAGNLMVTLGAGVVNNPAASATGTAVPADASYTGFNSGGNLVGVSSTNPLPVEASISETLNVYVTNPTTPPTSAASPVGYTVPNYAAYTGFNQGNDLVGVSSTNPLPVAISGTQSVTVSGTPSVTISGTPAVTVSGTVNANIESSGTAITNTSGALDVHIKSGAASGTQYADGTAVATPTGTVALGFDGSDVRALSTDTSGNLNANLYVNGSPNGVLHPVAISATGNPNSGSNPIIISVADGSGNISTMTAVGTAPAATTRALPVAAVLYAGATPTAIGTPVAAGTGNLSGNALTCNSSVYVGTAPASASNRLAVSASLTDGTTAISGAVSPLGFAPLGNAVLSANTVALPSAKDGAALNAQFINASGAAANIKSSSGNLYGLSLTNATASPAFIEFFNTPSTPTLGTSAVVFCVVIPANGNVTINPTTLGLMHFTSGIGFAATTAENGTTTAAVTGMIFHQ